MTNTALPVVNDRVEKVELRDGSREVRDQIASRFGFYLSPAVTFGTFGQLRDLVKQQGFTLAGVETIKDGSNDYVRIRCSINYRQMGKSLTCNGFMVFDPTNHWAMVESEVVGASQGVKIHRKLYYQKTPVGPCRPCERVVEVIAGPGGHQTGEFVFHKCELKDLPDDQFTLTAYGLPDVADPLPRRSLLGIIMTLFVAALACAGVAVLLRQRRRDLSRDTASD